MTHPDRLHLSLQPAPASPQLGPGAAEWSDISGNAGGDASDNAAASRSSWRTAARVRACGVSQSNKRTVQGLPTTVATKSGTPDPGTHGPKLGVYSPDAALADSLTRNGEGGIGPPVPGTSNEAQAKRKTLGKCLSARFAGQDFVEVYIFVAIYPTGFLLACRTRVGVRRCNPFPEVRWICPNDFTRSPMKSGKNGTGFPEINPFGYVSTT